MIRALLARHRAHRSRQRERDLSEVPCPRCAAEPACPVCDGTGTVTALARDLYLDSLARRAAGRYL